MSVEKENTEEIMEELTEEVTTGEYTLTPSSNPFVLGTMEGPFFGPIEEDNGNDRYYLGSTADKGIIGNPYVINMIDNKCLLGEPHHPIDRSNMWLDNACISTTSLKYSDDKRYIIGKADILDTPMGRIVWQLANYGCRLGISARANGKVVKVKVRGHVRKEVRPEYYEFKTFDVVLNPGFGNSMRPVIKDSYGKVIGKSDIFEEKSEDMSLYEELQDMIVSKSYDKEKLKNIINYIDDAKCKELLPLLEESSDTSTTSIEDSADISTESIESSDTSTTQEEFNDTSIAQLRQENSFLLEEVKGYKDEVGRLNEFINGYKKDLKAYEDIIDSVDTSTVDISEEVEGLLDELRESSEKRVDKYRRLYEESQGVIDSLNRDLQEVKNKLEDSETSYQSICEELSEKDGVIKELKDDNIKMKKMNEELEKSSVAKKASDKSGGVSKVKTNSRKHRVSQKVQYFNNESVVLNEEKESSILDEARVNLIKSLGGRK